jgi:dTDP-4-amino-4,6-dideoxygalactose transaminase
LLKKISLLHSFGHIGDDYYSEGINGKNSEFHAAMGLCNLPKLEQLISSRKEASNLYSSLLDQNKITRPTIPDGTEYNYAYYPVVFGSEEILLRVKNKLSENQINSRRYFFPSLNKLPYLDHSNSCPISEDIAKRVICLPMYFSLEPSNIETISKIVNYFA